MGKSKRKILKKIPSVFFIFLCFLIIFIYISLKDLASFSASLENYFKSGNSIFFPFLSNINILWFLSEINPNFRLSLGHLIDIIIFCQIFSYIDIFVYHVFVRRYLNIDLNILDFSEIVQSNNELPIQYEDPLINTINENDLDQYNDKINYIKWNSKTNEIFQYRFSSSLNKINFEIKKYRKLKIYKKYTFLIYKSTNNHYYFFNIVSFFKANGVFRLIFPCYYLIINKTYFNSKFKWIYSLQNCIKTYCFITSTILIQYFLKKQL